MGFVNADLVFLELEVALQVFFHLVAELVSVLLDHVAGHEGEVVVLVGFSQVVLELLAFLDHVLDGAVAFDEVIV